MYVWEYDVPDVCSRQKTAIALAAGPKEKIFNCAFEGKFLVVHGGTPFHESNLLNGDRPAGLTFLCILLAD